MATFTTEYPGDPEQPGADWSVEELSKLSEAFLESYEPGDPVEVVWDLGTGESYTPSNVENPPQMSKIQNK